MNKLMSCALALCLTFMVAGCGGKVSVNVQKAQMTEESFIYESKSHPEAVHMAPIIPPVSGAIISAIPDVGTVVEPGDVLFTVDSSAYQAQANELKRQIASGATVHPSYGTDDSMEASLLKQGIITRQEYERIKGRKGRSATYNSEAVDPSLTASLEAIEKLIDSCTVRAPIGGVISQVYVGDTKVATAGKAALVIRQDSPVQATIEIPSGLENELDEAKDNKTLTVSLSDGTDVWYGELKKQGNGKGSRYVAYKVQVDNNDDRIIIGNEYSVRIDSGRKIHCIVVPKSALIGEDSIAIVTSSNLVDIRHVDIAGEKDGKLLVVGGLDEGDQVITNPPKNIDIGMQVTVN